MSSSSGSRPPFDNLRGWHRDSATAGRCRRRLPMVPQDSNSVRRRQEAPPAVPGSRRVLLWGGGVQGRAAGQPTASRGSESWAGVPE
ncbi:hypothetical protein Micbo1qcDRAFT_157598, partial [Microdochium bolleyi]